MRFLSIFSVVAVLVTSTLAQLDFTVRLNVDQQDTTRYRQMLQSIRQQAKNPNQVSHGLPVCLPQQPANNPAINLHVFDVVLSTAQNSLRLRLRRDNLFIIGYRNENAAQWQELRTANQVVQIANSAAVGFTGSYTDLQGAAHVNRNTIHLGLTALQTAVNTLTGPQNGATIARHILVLIQMISEASRFIDVQNFVINNWRANPNNQVLQGLGALPSPYVIALETNWGALSAQLLAMDQHGGRGWQRPANLDLHTIVTVNDAVAVLGILLH